MKFNLENLDDLTRQMMVNEVDHDIINDQLYFSRKFSDTGKMMYTHLLKQAIIFGNEETLAKSLKVYHCFESHVPETDHQIFAEHAFNRLHMRATCVRAFENGQPFKITHTHQTADHSRTASETIIDKAAQLKGLLELLRKNMAVDKAVELSMKRSGELTAKAV